MTILYGPKFHHVLKDSSAKIHTFRRRVKKQQGQLRDYSHPLS